MRRVVITGLGVISPIGTGKDAFWTNALRGTSGAILLERVTCCDLFGQHEFGTQAVCEVSHFDPKQHQIPPRYWPMDRSIHFALAGAAQAFYDARLDSTAWERTRAGVALATAICGTQSLDREFVRATSKGHERLNPDAVSPHLYLAALGDTAARAVAGEYGFEGECVTLSTGCIGGLDAISYAYEQIKAGDDDLMLAGAAEAPISPITVAAFDRIHCLSRYPDDPRRASRPFDATRDGFVLAEGCGIVVLEELEHALARQAPIYAEIAGAAVTQHAQHMTDMSPEGRDLARAITLALDEAGLNPDALDFVNAHGTSTEQNDRCETLALKTALGERAKAIPINSTKSMTGHALAAASAIEVVACALSLRDQMVHPTINLEVPDPACDLDYVPRRTRQQRIRWLLTTASGFSGLHAALVMGTCAPGGER